MSEFVWSTHDMLFANGVFEARLLPGQVWWADDPLVKAHPEFFSATPLHVLSTVARPQPEATPLPKRCPVATVPVVDDAEQAVAAINVLAETNPTVQAVTSADRRRTRRG